MTATIQKWGNSHGIRIPKVILDEMGLAENDCIEIVAGEDGILLRPAGKKHKILKERLESFYGKELDSIALPEVEEIDTGARVGEEVW